MKRGRGQGGGAAVMNHTDTAASCVRNNREVESLRLIYSANIITAKIDEQIMQ